MTREVSDYSVVFGSNHLFLSCDDLAWQKWLLLYISMLSFSLIINTHVVVFDCFDLKMFTGRLRTMYHPSCERNSKQRQIKLFYNSVQSQSYFLNRIAKTVVFSYAK